MGRWGLRRGARGGDVGLSSADPANAVATGKPLPKPTKSGMSILASSSLSNATNTTIKAADTLTRKQTTYRVRVCLRSSDSRHTEVKMTCQSQHGPDRRKGPRRTVYHVEGPPHLIDMGIQQHDPKGLRDIGRATQQGFTRKRSLRLR